MRLRNKVALLCALWFAGCHAMVPKVEYNPRFAEVTGVEHTDSCTRLSVRLKNFHKYWVMIPSSTYLVAIDDTTCRFKAIGEENMPFDKKIRMPESCYQDGVLLFEPIQPDVKVVDWVIDDENTPKDNVLGIHLYEVDDQTVPQLLTAADIFNSKEKSAERWTGVEPSRYADMSFYKKGGVAHVKGKIDKYTPRTGFSTITVRTQNDITDEEKMNLGNIKHDGTFAFDVPLDYPQYACMVVGDIVKDILLMPGDTLDIVTTTSGNYTSARSFEPEYFRFKGELSDAALVSLLTDSILDHYSLNSLWRKYNVEKSDSMSGRIIDMNRQLCVLLDSTLTDLPTLIGDLPVSGMVKDFLTVAAVGKICERMEDLDMLFRHTNGAHQELDSLGKVKFIPGKETLDYKQLMAPRLKYKDLIYNNPLMLSAGWVLPNRWKYNSLFHPSGNIATGMESPVYEVTRRDKDKPIYDRLCALDEENERNIGLGNCFVAQLVRTVAVGGFIRESSVYTPDILARHQELVTNIVRLNGYAKLNEELMSAYTDYVRAMVSDEMNQKQSEQTLTLEDSPEKAVLDEIIAPYRGNVLFLDFWGVGCGPCRAGMIAQKPILERYADQPFKALYIADREAGKDACEKWLNKEGIKGEHIFISNDNWKRLNSLFNFSGIPFSVLIDKEGNVIETNYQIVNGELRLEEALGK
ncbi:MAG: TlpA family protein disulfide reductase [Muribaculaceae bacterium]|nr:TlpA family protein disulfide reductase [Muribaculaceae bacterium]